MDGASFYVENSKLDDFYKICNDFVEYMMSQLENLGYTKEVEFVLEYSEYKKLVISDVNNYLGIYLDNSYKFKGARFKSDFELHENKSFRVVNLAINNYFITGELPETFIRNYTNIYDFTGRQKANRDFNYELIKNNQTTILKRLIRYIVTTNGGILYKVKSEFCETNAAKQSNVIAPFNNYQPLVEICNKMPKNPDILFKNIDYDWYIDQAYKTIDKILKVKYKTRRILKQNSVQSDLFA